jgi:hypothetical protein
MLFTVYVPAVVAATTIDPGSGIVGTGQGDRLLIDFEGNRFGSSTMVTFADRVHHAAGRHKDRYPTIARHLVKPESMRKVGTFDDERGEVALDSSAAAAALAQWCSLGPTELAAQLLTAGSARHSVRREIVSALATGSPDAAFAVRHMSSQFGFNIAELADEAAPPRSV